MIDHLGIQVLDIDGAALFYDAILAPLGGTRIMDFEVPIGRVIGYGTENKPDFWLSPFAESDSERFRESHIAFSSPDRAGVDAFFAAATATGAEVLHAPRVFPEYHENYYGAFVRDRDGNNVEAVCHCPED